ncbi:MAG TPA: hypothetical protein PLX08_09325 [Bacteroidales bacterium]|nr:hypothetical protein [Bacteroidales bacterium]
MRRPVRKQVRNEVAGPAGTKTLFGATQCAYMICLRPVSITGSEINPDRPPVIVGKARIVKPA